MFNTDICSRYVLLIPQSRRRVKERSANNRDQCANPEMQGERYEYGYMSHTKLYSSGACKQLGPNVTSNRRPMTR
jgi:hypothetical protein